MSGHGFSNQAIVFEASCLSLPYTGIAQYTANLALALARLGEPTAAVLRTKDFDPARTEELVAGNVSIRRPPAALQNLLLMSERLGHQIGYDRLAGGARAIIFPNNRMFDSKVPSLATLHDLSPVVYPEFVDPVWRARAARRMHEIAEKASIVLTVSETVANQITSVLGVPHDRIRVIRMVTPARAAPSDSVPGVPGAVLAVGTLGRNKNYNRLILAHKMLDPLARSKHPLVIVGREGYGAAEIMVAAENDPYIIMTGGLSDTRLASMYRDAALFVQVSLYEGFGIPPLEALAANKPVLCSDIPALRESTESRADIYVNPYDVGLIADSINRLLDSEYNSHSAAHEDRSTHSWDSAARVLLRAIEDASNL